MFLENLIKFSLLIDCKNDRACKRHPHEVDENQIGPFGHWILKDKQIVKYTHPMGIHIIKEKKNL